MARKPHIFFIQIVISLLFSFFPEYFFGIVKIPPGFLQIVFHNVYIVKVDKGGKLKNYPNIRFTLCSP